jgi:hypothetical protein
MRGSLPTHTCGYRPAADHSNLVFSAPEFPFMDAVFGHSDNQFCDLHGLPTAQR